MKLPWTKAKRGAAKSASTKVKEEQAKMDAFLVKTYLDDLKAHPEYARQVAREKFGMSEHYEGGEGIESPDLLEVLKTANEAKKLLKGELGTEEGSWLKTIGTSFAEAFAPVVSQMIAGKLAPGENLELATRETPQLPEPKKRQPRDKVKEQQAAIKQYVESLFTKEPEEIALELYQNKDKEGDLRSILWQYTQNDFDTLLELLDKVSTIPNYEFLKPIIDKLDKKKLALVYDEVQLLIASEETVANVEETAENEE